MKNRDSINANKQIQLFLEVNYKCFFYLHFLIEFIFNIHQYIHRSRELCQKFFLDIPDELYIKRRGILSTLRICKN